MEKILISLPDDISIRFKAVIPSKQRSHVVATLIAKEVKRREELLYQCALDVENDKELNVDMENWDVTLKDGLSDE